MQDVSDRFRQEVRGSHTPAYSITLDGQELPVQDGTVTLDGQAATRGGLSLTLAVSSAEIADYVPGGIDSLLAPAGNEISVSRGVVYPDSTTELVPLGVFRIDDTNADDDGANVPIQVAALDRSSRIIEAVFETAGFTAAGTAVEDEIERVVREAWPGCPLDLAATDVTLPLLSWSAGDDRWEYCRALAEAGAADLFFSPTGTLTLRKTALRSLTPVLEIVEGDGGTLLKVGKRVAREGAANRVEVRGETSGADPVVGEAIDNDPNSPTYYGGKFGKVTFPWSSSYVTDSDKADDVAQVILNKKLGLNQQVQLESVVNPALEVFDTILVQRARMNIDAELHTVDSLSIPLTSSSPAMAVGTRLVAFR